MIIWNGKDIIGLVILGFVVLLGVAWVCCIAVKEHKTKSTKRREKR